MRTKSMPADVAAPPSKEKVKMRLVENPLWSAVAAIGGLPVTPWLLVLSMPSCVTMLEVGVADVRVWLSGTRGTHRLDSISAYDKVL